MSWLTLSTITLHHFFILHPKFKYLTVLFLNLMLFFCHVFLHFVKCILCGRNDIFYSLLRWRATILALINRVVHWILIIMVNRAILIHCELLLMVRNWEITLTQSESFSMLTQRNLIICQFFLKLTSSMVSVETLLSNYLCTFYAAFILFFQHINLYFMMPFKKADFFFQSYHWTSLIFNILLTLRIEFTF